MSLLVRSSTQELDGPYVASRISASGSAIRIATGAYALPFWVQFQSGQVIKVSRLPFQTVAQSSS